MPVSTGRFDMDDAADKQRLRAVARKLRATAQADGDGEAPERVAVHFCDSFKGGIGRGTVVAGYWPFGTEMDVRPLLARLATEGVELALPLTRDLDLPLEFRRWRPGDALENGAHGISQPSLAAPVVVPNILLVPLLAFDASGWRLGYGAGYYDRTLTTLRGRLLAPRPIAVGIAYAVQEMTQIPHHAGDQQLDWVVTEQAARRFG
jgi:5-formyltetrahydrofolate cyclo-ligase